MGNDEMEIRYDEEQVAENMPAENTANKVNPAVAGFIGGAAATGVVLVVKALFGKISKKRKAKKAAKEAAENAEEESED